jgi:hypothetical protein
MRSNLPTVIIQVTVQLLRCGETLIVYSVLIVIAIYVSIAVNYFAGAIKLAWLSVMVVPALFVCARTVFDLLDVATLIRRLVAVHNFPKYEQETLQKVRELEKNSPN